MTKSVGGRGHKAEKKYERFTASVSPEVLELLDQHAAAQNLNRSEMLSKMVERYAKMWPIRTKK